MTNHPPLHYLLDWAYDPVKMDEVLKNGADPNERYWKYEETALHVAVRRRRLDCIDVLLSYGAAIDAKTKGGKTAYAHAIRRGFTEISDHLAALGADTGLNTADELAVVLCKHDLDQAQAILATHPGLVVNMNAEEARILPDLAGRPMPAAVGLLLDAGIDITSRGLDEGTALHMSAWFGQLEVTRLLIARNAPLDIQGDLHNMSPLGWVVHGSVYSGSAESHKMDYAEIARALLEAGASLAHPSEPEKDPHGSWLLEKVSKEVEKVLRAYGAR
ncbi:MAG: ankyrin repeat domain-containing protein [Saprospiraceae bacterium]